MNLEKFKEYLILEGLSRYSVINYISSIKMIAKYIDIENLCQEKVNEYFVNLEGEEATQNQRRKALLKFIAYNKLDIKVPKFKRVEQSIPDYFSEEYFLNEIVSLIDMLFKNEIEVKCIFYLMFYTGLRIGEILNLKKSDFNLKEQKINIQKRKAKNPIVIYYPKELNSLIELQFDNTPEQEKMFELSSSSIRKYCKNLNQNLDKKIHPHMFRHSFAVMFLKKGGDISVLKELLGHKCLQSTLIYTKMTNEDIEKEYRKYIKIKRSPK